MENTFSDETTVVAAIKNVIGNSKGKCYVASEAAYHLLGGKKAGYTPVVFSVMDSRTFKRFSHWWLRRSDHTILDITADQFNQSPKDIYPQGRGCGFLTKKPSKKAQEIIDATIQYINLCQELELYMKILHLVQKL